MLGVLPIVVLGGAALLLTERFINQPYSKKRRKKPFDKLEERDNKVKFGDFRNVGF